MTGVNPVPGWYHAEGDPPSSTRFWDGAQWTEKTQTGGNLPPGMFADSSQFGGSNPQVPGGHHLADPWVRIGASVIDFVFLLIVGQIINSAVGMPSPLEAFSNPNAFAELSSSPKVIITTIFSSILGLLYFWGMNSFFSGTVGKLVVGIRIVDTQGQKPIGPGVGFKRTLNKVIWQLGNLLSSMLIFASSSGASASTFEFNGLNLLGTMIQIILGLVFLVIAVISLVNLFSEFENRQTVMDNFANTVVVKNKP